MQLQEDLLFDNRYRLKKLLGCGGFSEVWLVEDNKVGNKKMALKVYAPGTGLDEDGIQLFSSEFEIVFDLNHTNLLRPSHFDVCERSPFLLMPYSEQGAATKLVGKMTEEEAWRFLHDVASGLAYLHSQEPPIIHQDIKPDNILIDYLGHFQITDFGISAKVRSTLRKSVSNTAKSGGTVAYMPPERFGKDNIPIKASDIWAMGATIFELLAGDLPFGENGGLIQKSGAEIPNMPGPWSDELQEIITRCLQKDPWDRPVAQQIVSWTEKHFNNDKITFDTTKQPSNSIPEQLSEPQTNNKKRVIIFGILVPVIIALVVIIFSVVNKSPSPEKTITENSLTVSEEQTVSVPPAWMADYERIINLAQSAYSRGDFVSAKEQFNQALTLVVQNGDKSGKESTVKELIASCDQAIRNKSQADEQANITAWLADYDRILNAAQLAYGNEEYEKAKSEYNRALALANRNRDRSKATFVNGQIALCDKAIEEMRQKEIKDRLATYNFVGNFALGPSYWVVQKKSNNLWGIIDREGNEKEAATYNQISARLKNDYYALKNSQGWVVFDTSLNKIASGIQGLEEYQ
ncbi:MAG: serine/threonine protein kinase [Tannerella sp.]|jgi:serine/threonine protein kinase|nr:serine/threonine protein kinase [Tannerella sp.]